MNAEGLTTFVHPQKAYRLEYPAHWEHLEKENGRDCGFGPRERDDVGLWISVMPFSLDTDRLAVELPQAFEQSLSKAEAVNLRPDPTLHHHAMKADITAEGQAGNYWLMAGAIWCCWPAAKCPRPSATPGTPSSSG
jgi:hypothetical protein